MQMLGPPRKTISGFAVLRALRRCLVSKALYEFLQLLSLLVTRHCRRLPRIMAQSTAADEALATNDVSMKNDTAGKVSCSLCAVEQISSDAVSLATCTFCTWHEAQASLALMVYVNVT